MAHGIWLAVAPLPTEADIPTLHDALSKALPHPTNIAYIHGLCHGQATALRPQIAAARLGALALLPPLLTAAGMDATHLRLGRDEHGRPLLSDARGPWTSGHSTDFNLSHAAAHIACALLVGDGRVGVDIEEHIPPTRAAALAARYATSGEQALLASDEWDFTRLWTVREALAKQDGRGMPLRHDASAIPANVRLWCGRTTDTHASLCLCVPAGTEDLPIYAVTAAVPPLTLLKRKEPASDERRS